MTSLTTLSTISSFDRFAAQPEHAGRAADRQLAGAAAAPQRLRRAGTIVAVLAMLAAAVLPAHTASAAQSVGHATQAGAKDIGPSHRVPGTCTPSRCR